MTSPEAIARFRADYKAGAEWFARHSVGPLLAAYDALAAKADLYAHMKEVAEANGFESLTDAIARAVKAEAALAEAKGEVERLRQTDRADDQHLPMDCAPRDGTIVRLLVDYRGQEAWTPLEDAEEAWTIGANNFDNDGEDRWRFAGWSWTHDYWCEGSGSPIGWAPFNNHVDKRDGQ